MFTDVCKHVSASAEGGLGSGLTTKVDSLAAGAEQEQTIEPGEEHGGGLVDSAEDSLTALGESLDEVADGPRRLGVQARCRFIEEDQELGTGGKFNTDSQALTLFDVETFAGEADDCIRKALHL
jgi:hypothetical protein